MSKKKFNVTVYYHEQVYGKAMATIEAETEGEAKKLAEDFSNTDYEFKEQGGDELFMNFEEMEISEVD